jgi:hypothetical protein
VAYVRTVRTASGATAVQIVHGSRRGSRTIEHVGSAHDELELEALMAASRQRLAGGQTQLDLGLDPGTPVGAENSVRSCDLHVLVDEAAEPVSS